MRASLKRVFPLLIILSFALSLHAQETVKILRVVDGDTLKINYKGKQESIRLIGIDAPESRGNPRAKREKGIFTKEEYLETVKVVEWVMRIEKTEVLWEGCIL